MMMMPGIKRWYAPESAKEYLANAGVKESNNYLYKLAVMVVSFTEMDDRTLDKLKQSLQNERFAIEVKCLKIRIREN
ncbi:hypothetical protein P7H12_24920 [Paenibacillus larvae]|nr:hypothetical protein [Paenibacillus larvae]MDT2266183.1 hypothetical protein [Paenibacillus larvae]